MYHAKPIEAGNNLRQAQGDKRQAIKSQAWQNGGPA